MILNSLNKFLCLSELLSISMDVVVTGNKVEFIGCGIYLVDNILNPSNDCCFNSVNLNQDTLSKFDEYCKLVNIKLYKDNIVDFIFIDKFDKTHNVSFTFDSNVEKPANNMRVVKRSVNVDWMPNNIFSELFKRQKDDYINVSPKGVLECDGKEYFINDHTLIFNCLEQQVMYHVSSHRLMQCFDKGVYIKSFIYSSDDLIYNDGVEYSNGCRHYFTTRTHMKLVQRILNNFNTQLEIESVRRLNPNFTLLYVDYKKLIEQIKYYNKKHKYINSEEFIVPTIIHMDKENTKFYITLNNLNKGIDESYGEFLARCPEDYIELITINADKFEFKEPITIAIDSYCFEKVSTITVDDNVEFIIYDRNCIIRQVKNNMIMTIHTLCD